MLNDKGYTYIELAIVLAIIAIITSVIMPSFRVLKRYELKQEAESVRETIRYAQKLAMSENKGFEVKITGDTIIEVISGIESIKKVTLKNGVAFTSIPVDPIVKYNSKGIAKVIDGAGVKDITLKNEYETSLDIQDITGRVELGEITN